MAHPLHHAESSAKKFGGKPEDYQAIHDWFDATKEVYADFRHRALRHHSQGIFECERVFGLFIVNSAGRKVPVRFIGEQHVKEDCGGQHPDRRRLVPLHPARAVDVEGLYRRQPGRSIAFQESDQ